MLYKNIADSVWSQTLLSVPKKHNRVYIENQCKGSAEHGQENKQGKPVLLFCSWFYFILAGTHILEFITPSR